MAWPSLAPPPAESTCSSSVISVERGGSEPWTDAGDPRVAHQKVRATAQQANGHVLLAAIAAPGPQFVPRVGLGEVLAGPPR